MILVSPSDYSGHISRAWHLPFILWPLIIFFLTNAGEAWQGCGGNCQPRLTGMGRSNWKEETLNVFYRPSFDGFDSALLFCFNRRCRQCSLCLHLATWLSSVLDWTSLWCWYGTYFYSLCKYFGVNQHKKALRRILRGLLPVYTGKLMKYPRMQLCN